MEAEKITDIILDDHDISFAGKGIIDNDKLREVQNMDYAYFKTLLNAKKDFCLYLQDETGKIIFAKGATKLSDEASCTN